MSQPPPTHIAEDRRLAAAAAAGDPAARARVNALVDPILRFQSDRFCKRYCYDNRHRYACTLADPWGAPPEDALWCEWGNGSYAWMLEDLAGPGRLRAYQGRDGAGLYAYLFAVANSLPFYERWKDWRFGRRLRAPSYVTSLHAQAGRVFLALQAGEAPPLIAQKLGLDEPTVTRLAQQIVVELTRRKRLHLLDPPRGLSLEAAREPAGEDAPRLPEPASAAASPEQVEERRRLGEAWRQLDGTERFVLEAMLIEGRDANEVLAAMRSVDGAQAAVENRQQLYYLRRKALARLARLAGYDR